MRFPGNFLARDLLGYLSGWVIEMVVIVQSAIGPAFSKFGVSFKNGVEEDFLLMVQTFFNFLRKPFQEVSL